MVLSVAQAPSLRIAEHLRVGCSTGFLAPRGDWPALTRQAATISTVAIELAALSASELPGLAAYLDQRPRLPFQYVSLHAPSKDIDVDERRLIASLAELSPRVDTIVVHPDTLHDVAAWGQIGRRLALENMDLRKPDGRTADELANYFAVLPEARLCFDIAHAHDVEPSMLVAREILERFGARLRHMHISSLDESQHHVPLTSEHEDLFDPLLERCRDVPWILEAPIRRD